MINITRKMVGQTVAGLAAALALTVGASAAHATAVTWIDLDAENAAYGATLDVAGPDSINGYIAQVGHGVSISDTGYDTTAVWGHGDKFVFNYDFSIGGANIVSGNIVKSPTTGINDLKIKLVDLTTHTLVQTGVLGTGASAGYLVISAANLLSTDTYDLVVTGRLAHGVGAAGFNGSVSAVPLPGTLALFGSALLGLGGLARRRRAKGVAALAVLLAVPAAMTLGAGNAVAGPLPSEIVDTVNLGNLPAATLNDKEKVDLNASINSSGVLQKVAGYYTPGETSQAATTTTVVGGPYAAVLDYDFTVAGTEKISTNVSSLSGALAAADFTLVDLTTHTVVGTSSSANNGFLTISSILYSGNDYQYVVDLPKLVKGSSLNGVGSVSAVPVPGSLVLFGSGLVGLAAFGRRARKKLAA